MSFPASRKLNHRDSSFPLRHTGRHWLAALAALAFAFGPAVASADSVSLDLTVEFDDGLIGNYGEVTIEEVGGGLNFSIVLTGALGPDLDLHRFYFDWVGPAGLVITADDAPTTPYALAADPPVAGGAGTSFDYGVNFGNGGGASGNGRLSSASFRLEMGGSTLDLGMLGESVAVHVQNTALVDGADSETVGGTVPEATTGALFSLGLVLIASVRSGRRPVKRV